MMPEVFISYAHEDRDAAERLHWVLSDRVFAMVFRRLYGAQVDQVSVGAGRV